MATRYASGVPDLWQLLDEPIPKLLGFRAGRFVGKHRETIACHLDPSARIGAEIEAPGGIVVTAEIEGPDGIAVPVLHVGHGGRPWPAGATPGRCQREYRLTAGEQPGSANQASASPQEEGVQPTDLRLNPAQPRKQTQEARKR